jgi:transcriptional regulator of arginine metabolism
MFADVVNTFDYSENIILIRAMPGTAQAVAALLDNVGWKEILGTVAGDDTVMLIIKPKEAVYIVMERLQKLHG